MIVTPSIAIVADTRDRPQKRLLDRRSRLWTSGQDKLHRGEMNHYFKSCRKQRGSRQDLSLNWTWGAWIPTQSIRSATAMRKYHEGLRPSHGEFDYFPLASLLAVLDNLPINLE